MRRSPLQAEALVAHVFVAADGEDREADLRFVLDVWRACGEPLLGMIEPLRVPGLPVDPSPVVLAEVDPGSRLLAGRQAPTPDGRESPYVQQALLRREHDTLCISVMRELPPATGKGWPELDDEWSRLLEDLSPPAGLLGSVRLFLARLAGCGSPRPDAALTKAIQARWRVLAGTAQPFAQGVRVPPGFVVWEDVPPTDGRVERRMVVVAGRDDDAALSAWTWVVGAQELPRFGRYLLHAAKLRYQWRVWHSEQGFRQARRDADATVDRLLPLISPSTVGGPRRQPSQAQLVRASQELVTLQAGEVGLVQTSTRLREMRRTVDIAASNLTALTGGVELGGLFADDRALAAWFGQQLDDDAAYLDAARERVSQVGTLADQLISRGQQRRQERFNLGLTGVIGAILMALAAIQSLQYTLAVPGRIKPAIVTALGLLALLVSLVVLRAAVPDRRWPAVLVWLACGGTAAAVAWIASSAITGTAGSPGQTWLWARVGFAGGFITALAIPTLRR